MIAALAITILVESAVVIAYAIWQRKPLIHLLLSSLCANFLTQACLWAVINIFPHHYLETLLLAEVCIWAIEALLLFFYRCNRLKLLEAILLSLIMNLTSFGIGWLLPI